MILTTQTVVHYIKTAAGKVHGPYGSRTIAESILLNMAPSEREGCIIESKTEDGKDILLG